MNWGCADAAAPMLRISSVMATQAAKLGGAFAVAAMAAACTLGPDYHATSATDLGIGDGYSAATARAAQVASAGDLSSWWDRFDDPLMSSLVQRARANNLDIAQAVARLRQAHEALIQSRAELLPQVTGTAGYTRSFDLAGSNAIILGDGTTTTVASTPANSFSLGGSVSYQVGLFGEFRRTVEASRATYEASGYDYATVVTSVEAEVARNYVLARLYQSQLAAAHDTLSIEDGNLEIAGYRVQAGLVSSVDREQARASRAQVAATIPAIEQNYAAAVARLGVLIGATPGALRGEMAAVRTIPVGPADIGIGVPADTLRQRPDVRAAERRLAAATAQIGVAKAQLYPNLAISGSINTNSSAVGGLFQSIAGSLFAGLTQAIFNGGRLRSQVRAQEAAAQGAFSLYKSTVLAGLEDVENAAVAIDTAHRRATEYAIAYDAASNTAILARTQYRAGLTDFTTLNNAEAGLLSARNGLSQSRADEATAVVQLYLALGGGWTAGAAPQASGSA